jgi:hypothetical protein
MSCRAECRGAVLHLARHRQEQVAADRGDDRHDHDRQDQAGGEHADSGALRVAEDREESEVAVEPGLQVALDERREDEDPPEAEDHARDRGERLHQRADDSAHATGCQQGQVEPDRNRERRGQQERHPRADDRSVERSAGAEDVLVRLPERVGDEAETELGDRGAGPVDHLVGHQTEHCDGDYGRKGTEPVEDSVADPVAGFARLEGRNAARNGSSRWGGGRHARRA